MAVSLSVSPELSTPTLLILSFVVRILVDSLEPNITIKYSRSPCFKPVTLTEAKRPLVKVQYQ